MSQLLQKGLGSAFAAGVSDCSAEIQRRPFLVGFHVMDSPLNNGIILIKRKVSKFFFTSVLQDRSNYICKEVGTYICVSNKNVY